MEGSIDELRGEDHPLFGSPDESYVPGATSRSHRHRAKRRNRRRRLFPILSFVLILALIGTSYLLVRSAAGYFRTPDYSGSGTGSTRITIDPGDGASDVAAALVKAGSVESGKAFVNAAKKSGRASDIQPGVFRVPLHASGAAALAAILNPANKLVTQVTIPEGYTQMQVLSTLADRTGLPLKQLQAAAGRLGNLNLPDGFAPRTIEGFLYPATYQFNPGSSADEVVQQLTSQFSSAYAQLGLADAARAAGITPYQALIIASIIEGEAKFDADRPKVARVILNRLAAHRPLQIDAISVYGAKVAGLDPKTVDYATLDSPYNSYTHPGLPPSPIDNPGDSSLKAAVQPASGSWLYYVNGDAAGHLSFFTDESQFLAAAAKCKANGWGCG
ncbi:MAG TPA: endolytic transglycosylase MltG [Jatrophihabitans sp.]|nr:endolytic transglycosylase MltG [Jatrophihabitans sp.]